MTAISDKVRLAAADGVGASAAPAAVRMVADAEGPAMLVRPDGRVRCANRAAAPLLEALRAAARPDASPQATELRGLVLGASLGGPSMHRIALGAVGDEARQSFELALLPHEEGVLVLGRDVGFEDNLTRALLESRGRYRDLMRCSADFGWETDREGGFRYIGPGGALGYPARALAEMTVADILAPGEEPAESPFLARRPQRNVRVEARDRKGRRVLLAVSALPFADAAGRPSGTRGIARDITREHEREVALRLDHAREALLGRILMAIRGEQAPEDILRVAAEAAGEALRAESARAFLVVDDHGEQPPAIHIEGARRLRALVGEALASAGEGGEEEEVRIEVGVGSIGALRARVGDPRRFALALVLARDSGAEPWRAHEVELLHGIAGHLAIALKQAAMLRRLERLSSRDDLTGLLNRRAFLAGLRARMRHQCRSGRPGHLLLVDLDHFKALNDTLGHAAGDAALAAFGERLAASSRAGDLAGRLGGDEFAIWLEDTPQAGAIVRAKALLGEVASLRAAAGDPAAPLSLSIGIAACEDAHGNRAHELLEAADAALYEAKRGGRAGWRLARQSSAEADIGRRDG